MEESKIKQQARDWIRSNWDPDQSLLAWRTMLLESGWGVPGWPKDFFGLGLTPANALEVDEVFSELGAIGAANSGVRMLAAATLLEHANDSQKQRYLPGIVTGAESWCQLFSEPGSGSDLAGATTKVNAMAMNGSSMVKRYGQPALTTPISDYYSLGRTGINRNIRV